MAPYTRRPARAGLRKHRRGAGADVASGRLHRGERLPTHRALAKALGVDLTTVTRAYNEARRRGLTEARVGQGTFVAESRARAPRAAAAGIEFDLSMNLPPEPVEADLEGRIARGLAALRRDFGLSDFLSYQQAGGSEADRGVAADWLRRASARPRPSRLVDLSRHADRADGAAAVAHEAGRRRAHRSSDLSRLQGRGRGARRAPGRRRRGPGEA